MLFENLKPEAPGQLARVTVQFDFDVNGILHVTAADRGSGRKTEMTFTAAYERLSPAQMEESRAHVATLAAAPAETVALLAKARRILQSERDDLDRLQSVTTELEDAIREGRTEDQELLEEELVDLLYDLEE